MYLYVKGSSVSITRLQLLQRPEQISAQRLLLVYCSIHIILRYQNTEGRWRQFRIYLMFYDTIIVGRRVHQWAVRIFAVVFVVLVTDAVVLQLQVDRAAVGVTVRWLIVVAAVTAELREGQQTDSGCTPLVFAIDTGGTETHTAAAAAHDNSGTTTDVHLGGGGIHYCGSRVGGNALQAVVHRRHSGFGFHVYLELDGL